MFRSIALGLALIASPAVAGQVTFSSGWSEQRLQIFNSNDFSLGNSLGIISEGAVSLVWTRMPRSEWGSRAASWNWEVSASVPPTNLGQRGGDDRNISVYFVFLPEAVANQMEGANIRQLNRNPDVRILQYVWGGNHGRGEIIGSPYAPGQGVTVALRQAGTGSHSESVDLARDYAVAFGGTPGALVGLAVSADSDDTDTVIRAGVSPITLR